jgi:hypothetical protein
MRRVIGLTVPLLLTATPVLAISTGIGGFDNVTTQWMNLITGPVAFIAIAAGIALFAWSVIHGAARHFGESFSAGVGLIAGGAILAGALPFLQYFFPSIGMLIR